MMLCDVESATVSSTFCISTERTLFGNTATLSRMVHEGWGRMEGIGNMHTRDITQGCI